MATRAAACDSPDDPEAGTAAVPDPDANAAAVPDPVAVGRFADRWFAAVASGSYVGLSAAEVRSLLHELSRRLATVLAAEPFDPAEGEAVGSALVDAHFTDAVSIGQTIEVLAALPASCPWLAAAEGGARVDRLRASLATGYARATWLRTLTEQEQARRAVFEAVAMAHSALRASEARFRAVFHSAGVGIAVIAPGGTIDEVNTAMTEMTGRTADELTGAAVDLILDADHRQLFDRVRRGEEHHVRFEQRHVRPDGRPAWIDLTASAIRSGEDRPGNAVLMARDVTQRHLLAGRLQHEATHDPLTRLPNRALFFDVAQQRIRRQPARSAGSALCYLDLDGFKAVNDTLGHDVGDELLAAVAERLRDLRVPARPSRRPARRRRVRAARRRSTGVDQVTELAEAVLAALRQPFDAGRAPAHRLRQHRHRRTSEPRGTTAAELMQAADTHALLGQGRRQGRAGRSSTRSATRDRSPATRCPPRCRPRWNGASSCSTTSRWSGSTTACAAPASRRWSGGSTRSSAGWRRTGSSAWPRRPGSIVPLGRAGSCERPAGRRALAAGAAGDAGVRQREPGRTPGLHPRPRRRCRRVPWTRPGWPRVCSSWN